MYSLRRRLLISATILLLVFLGIMGLGLNSAFKRSVLSSAEDALRNQILLLISSVEVIDGAVVMPPILPEPRLQQPDSDLFAQILVGEEGDKAVVWRSKSLFERSIPFKDSLLGNFKFFPSNAWEGSSINTMTLSVEWEAVTGTVPFEVQVAESDTVYKRRLVRYQRQVGVWLIFFGGALIVLLLGILRWALQPLERVRTEVGEIEEGRRERFNENYPLEVSRLTQNLNQLLNFEEERIIRQREVLGNLAHSLKTPIAVLKGLGYSRQVKAESDEQLEAMQTIIDYQLQSASAVGRRRFSKAIDIREPSGQIVRSLEKLHSTKELTVNVDIEEGVVFFGDKGDWMEVFGNLCDNAFKWAQTHVSIRVEQVELGEHASHKKPIRLVVSDDGPGIDESQRDLILQRGVRLDSQTPGHGLGMHIVKGVVDAYDGQIMLGVPVHSKTGTRFEIILN